MFRPSFLLLSLLAASAGFLPAQDQSQPPAEAGPLLRINSRAVLVDVIVTDGHGNTVTGLKQDAFTVTEQGKPETIRYFEEHRANQQPQAIAMPKLPPDFFTNFSPFPQPPAVTVLLLDSLNTRMENQSYVHAQALKFLKTAKPGSRMAIFTMGLGLHFIQGFTDDPTVLLAALNNKKNNEVESSVMLKGQAETNAQQDVLAAMSEAAPGGGTIGSADAVTSLRNFLQENDDSRTVDRDLLTMANFQRLAEFLNSFPGRKNVIWFSESFPLVVSNYLDSRIEAESARTLDMLGAARVALYPVDAAGTDPPALFDAGTQLPGSISSAPQMLQTQQSAMLSESEQRNLNQGTMKMLAEQTGGKAFMNGNGLAEIIRDVAESSQDFYTLSYAPADVKMNGAFRRIQVKVSGGNYHLSYRRGYVARDEGLPGSGEMLRERALHRLAQNGPVDPLLPFMDLGMPQSEQILIEAKIKPIAVGAAPQPGDPKSPAARYSVDFALATSDLRLPVGPDGRHDGTINLSLVAYDRYGNVVSRKDQTVRYRVAPDLWKVYQSSGVQLHAEIAVPKSAHWLRTGIFDQQSHKVGTMEVPLAAVKPEPGAASQPARAGK